MKKQKMSLKELYALAKGKPASCCETNSATEGAKRKETGQCCEIKKDSSCC